MTQINLSDRMDQITPFHVMRLMALAKALEEQGHDVVHMEVGEPDFPTPEPIIKAAQSYLAQGHVHYTTAAGLYPLRERIADFYQQRYRVSVDPGRIFITPGASGALMVALAAILDPGDEVLLTDPGYPCNANLIRLYGGMPRGVAVDVQSQFHFTSELVSANWQSATRALLMASPSNPTGSLIPRNALKDIIECVHQSNGVMLSDEIYHGLVYENAATSVLEFTDEAMVINSFSKYFGMTGWRLGWLVVPDEFQSAAERLIQNFFIAAPTHSQYAALAAFEPATMALLEQRREIFKERRDVLMQGLLDIGFSIPVKPEGAFYIYADCAKFTDDSEALAMQILNQAHVAITPGLDFGTHHASNYLRFAYTTQLDDIRRGLDRLAQFLQRI